MSNVNDLPADEQITQTSVLFYGPNENGSTWGALKPPTVFSNGTGTNNGFGPEISIGQHMVVSGTYDLVAEVKYAKGGTNLAGDWNPNRPNPYMYAQLLARTGTAIDKLRSAYPDRQVFVAGFFWMQGESDALSTTMAAAYATNLTNLIQHVRADFHSPLLPVFVGRITGHFPYAEMVRQAEMDVAANVADVRMVDTDWLPLDPNDGIHYTSAGTVTLGNDFAASYIGWLSGQVHIFLPMVAANASPGGGAGASRAVGYPR